MTLTLGEQVREARVGAGLTLRELARQLSRAPSYINDIEHDRRVPSEEVLADIANALNLDAGDLLTSAGRVSSDAVAYMQRTPQAGVLFRKMSGANLAGKDLDDVLKQVEKLIDERDQQDPR